MSGPVNSDECDQPFRIYKSANDFALRRPTTVVTPPGAVGLTGAPQGSVEDRTPPRESAADLTSRAGPTLVTTVDGSIPAEIETHLTQILASTPMPGETIELAYRRKEHEIGTLFARLSALESRVLHERLTLARSEDALATQFSRLVEGRRLRLLAFLNDARRREAIVLSGR